MTDQENAERRSLVAAALCVPIAFNVSTAVAASADENQNNIRAVLLSYADAWRRGDVVAITNLYHDDFTLHYPGTHALAGTHVGKATSLQILRTVNARTNRKLVSILDVMAGSHRGCLNVTEKWTRKGETALLERVFVYTVRDAKLEQCWLFDANQEIVAKYLAGS
jgi:ketosteroid isomerase-like protein